MGIIMPAISISRGWMKLGLSKYSESAKPKKHINCHSGLCLIISEFSRIEIPPLPTTNKSFLFTDPSLYPLTLPKPIPPPLPHFCLNSYFSPWLHPLTSKVSITMDSVLRPFLPVTTMLFSFNIQHFFFSFPPSISTTTTQAYHWFSAKSLDGFLPPASSMVLSCQDTSPFSGTQETTFIHSSFPDKVQILLLGF